MIEGSCLCGAVSWSGAFSNPDIFLCHCSQCRQQHGSLGAFIDKKLPAKLVKNLSKVRWYRSSLHGERGYCADCGSKMFWREMGTDTFYPVAGTVDGDAKLHFRAHIHTFSKGDYYDIPRDETCYAASSQDASPVDDIPKKKQPQGRAQHHGRCLCGKIHFTVDGKMRPVVYCHCGQCHHWHGFYPGYSAAKKSQLSIMGEEYLAWYRSSDIARRGFCKECGSSLFWAHDTEEFISITAGSILPPTDLAEGWHIFMKDKPSWYKVKDGLKGYPGTTPNNAQF